MPSNAQLTAFDRAHTKPDSSKFRQYVGCINWTAEEARPDVSAVAHRPTRHLNNLSNTHMAIAILEISPPKVYSSVVMRGRDGRR